MTVRVMAYNSFAWDEYGPELHGAVRRIGAGAETMVGYPDRGRHALGDGSGNKAFPLCMTENYLICTRLFSAYDAFADIVYAAPLRSEYTYSSPLGGQYTIGVQGFLYDDGYIPDIEDEGDVSWISGTDDVSSCTKAMAVWLGGDKALVLWSEPSNPLLMALCEPTQPSLHRRSVLYASSPTPLAVGVDTSQNLRIAARFGTAIRISAPIPIATFGSSSADVPFDTAYPHPVLDELTEMYSAIAALASTMGSDLIKIVGWAPLKGYSEGSFTAGGLQVVAVPPNTGGSIAIYTPEPYDGIDIPDYVGGISTLIYQGEMTYSIGPTAIGFELNLPTEWWNPDAAMGSRWVDVPLATFFAADADLVVPTVPPFWQNLVKAQERV